MAAGCLLLLSLFGLSLFLPLVFVVPYWFNSLIHFFGGIIAAFLAITFFQMSVRIWWDATAPWLKVLIVVSIATLLGVFWELFEYQFFSPPNIGVFTDVWFYRDTIRDLKMDIVGSTVLALFYAAFRK